MSWPVVKLGDICNLFNGYAFKSGDYVESSNTLSCRMSNIRPGGEFDIDYNARYLPDDFAEKHGAFLLKDGDVIIAMTDLAGSPKILGVPTVVSSGGRSILLNQRVGKLEILDSDKVYFPYLRYALSDPKVRSIYKKFAGGGLQINLGKDDLLSVQIPLPPLETQKQIAAVLEKADQLRKDCKLLEQELNSLAQSVFIDMFGDPLINPKGWQPRTLNEFYASPKTGTKCGPFGSALKKEEFVDSGIPVWNMSNISLTGEFIDSPTLWITEDKYKQLESYDVLQGDVIISRAGTVGKMGVVSSEYDRSIISTNLIRVRFGDDLLPLYFVCLMTYCKTRLKRLKVGDDGSFSHMNTGILDNIEFPYPPMKEQLKYMKFRENLDLQLGNLNQLKGEHESSFNSLMQKAFKGELNLNEIEKEG